MVQHYGGIREFQSSYINYYQTKHQIYGYSSLKRYKHSVDGRNPANQLRLVVHPIIYRVLYISGGAGFLPSTVFLGNARFF